MTTFIKDNAEFKLFKDSFIKWCLFRFNREYPLTDKNVCNYTDEVLNYYMLCNYGNSHYVDNIVFDENNLKASIINSESKEFLTEWFLIENNGLNPHVLHALNKHIDDNTIN